METIATVSSIYSFLRNESDYRVYLVAGFDPNFALGVRNRPFMAYV